MSRKCKVCKTAFEPTQPFQTWCCPDHGFLIAAGKLDKIKKAAQVKDKRETKTKLDAMKTRGQWLAEAKKAAQQFRRLEELANGSGCISCGRSQQEVAGTDGWKPGGAWDGGHFLSKGARPELALEPLNIWLQCKSCNGGSSKYARKGYTVNAAFRLGLIDRIGIETVEWLETDWGQKHYSIDDLKQIKQTYMQKTKLLKEANQ